MTNTPANTTDYLIRGSDYLKNAPDFELIGRDQDLERMTKVLMRKRANNILIVGPGGVGASAICMGLQTSKDKPDASYDIVSKRFFWLDTDGLFASGNTAQINEAFQRTLKTLSRAPETVLVIDDMRDFIEGARNNGCSNLINALMREIKQKKFQAIFEAGDDDLEVVLKCHSDMQEFYTLLDIDQPDPAALKLIVESTAKRLESHHRIRISEEARLTAIDLTNKYRTRDLGLSRAQPERSVTLLDRALATYRLKAHERDPRLGELETRLASVVHTLADPNYSAERGGKTREELEALKVSLETDVREIGDEWKERQGKIKALYKDMRKAEEKIRELEDEMDAQLRKEEEQRNRLIAQKEANGEDLAPAQNAQSKLGMLSAQMEQGNFGSDAVNAIKEKIARYRGLADENKATFEALTADLNEGLELTAEHVLAEFSAISGVPVDKLTQNEKAKLRNLEANLGNRVWGQEEAVAKLADEVLIAKAGLQDPDKPQGAFLYLGPSGVGKTELAKALAAELLDDEKALLRFDMSEYQEKHALAKLIGAPPGYEGYEAGGILTNEMRRNPRRIILFDEIEKAHPDIFLVFLQILDDARLTDNRGLTVSFRDSIIIMTSNTGKEHFVNPNLSFDEAKENAISELDTKLPPELLNRFNGRQNIVCFDKLSLPIIEKIAARDVGKLNKMVQASRPGLQVEMKAEDIAAMCKDHYEPVQGARGIVGYIKSMIKPAIARTLLFDDSAEGKMQVDYDAAAKKVTVHPAAEAKEEPKLTEPGTASQAANKQFAPAS